MLSMLCCLGQETEGQFLVFVCFTAESVHILHLQKAMDLQQRRWSVSQFVGIGVARIARQASGLFPEVTRNEEA